MYHIKTTIMFNAIPSYKPEKAIIETSGNKPERAIIDTSGNKPKKKNTNPEFIMLYVNPLKIFKSIWPDRILAASLKPNDTFLVKYEINSIKTNKGSKPKGQPDGTNREKNLSPCLLKPKIVAPKTIVKLSEKVYMKWVVGASILNIFII